MQSLGRINYRDIEAIGGADFFHSVIPMEADERSASIMKTRLNATLQREILCGNDSFTSVEGFLLFQRYFPPLRWFIERKMAVVLNAELLRLSQQPVNPLTRNTHEQLELNLKKLQQAQHRRVLPVDASTSAPPGSSFEIPALPFLPPDGSN